MVLVALTMVLVASTMVLVLPHVDVSTVVPASVHVDEYTVVLVDAPIAVTVVEDDNDLVVARLPSLVPGNDLIGNCIVLHGWLLLWHSCCVTLF